MFDAESSTPYYLVMNTNTAERTAIDVDRPPAEVAAEVYRAFSSPDSLAIKAHLADDVVLHVPGNQPLSGDHRGPDGVVQFLIASRALTDDGERVELIDVLGGARFAAGYCRITGERHGREPLDNTSVHLMRIEAGLVCEIWFHNWDQGNVDQFWR
jgi:ketosteroid isomerase-like protein